MSCPCDFGKCDVEKCTDKQCISGNLNLNYEEENMKYYHEGVDINEALFDSWARGLPFEQIRDELLVDFGYALMIEAWTEYNEFKWKEMMMWYRNQGIEI